VGEALAFSINMNQAWAGLDALEQLGEQAFLEASRRAGLKSARLIETTMRDFITNGMRGETPLRLR